MGNFELFPLIWRSFPLGFIPFSSSCKLISICLLAAIWFACYSTVQMLWQSQRRPPLRLSTSHFRETGNEGLRELCGPRANIVPTGQGWRRSYLFVCLFCRYLFPGVLWGLCRVNTNVALWPASREKCPSWGVRHARSRVGQIHHSCRSPVWIECLLDWSLVPFTQNAVRHGKRWPHFQVRIIQAFRIRFSWHATLYLQIVWKNRFLINFQSFL